MTIQRERPARPTRRRFCAVAAAVLLGAAATLQLPPAQAADYPTRPITIIAPVGAGSSGDFTLRILADKMSTILGQRMIVENVTGASGMMGTARAAKAQPDGYTLVGGGDTILTTVPIIYPNPGYDPLTDFIPISQVARLEWALVAAPNFKPSTVGELLEAAKADPGKITFASGGNGSPQQIAMELMAYKSSTKLQHVPYRSAANALTDVVGGFVSVMFTATSVAMPFLQDGKLKLLATAGTERSPITPQVPTVAEAGVPGFEFASYVAILAPAKTPPAIVEKLNAAALAALSDPDVRSKMAAAGVIAWGTSSADFARDLAEDYSARAALIKAVGIKVSD